MFFSWISAAISSVLSYKYVLYIKMGQNFTWNWLVTCMIWYSGTQYPSVIGIWKWGSRANCHLRAQCAPTPPQKKIKIKIKILWYFDVIIYTTNMHPLMLLFCQKVLDDRISINKWMFCSILFGYLFFKTLGKMLSSLGIS